MNAPTPPAAPQPKKRLGDLLVEGGVITQAQLQSAMLHQDRTGAKLGQALVELKFVTEQVLQDFLNQQRRKVRVGDLLVQRQLINEEQLKRALDEQKRTGMKLGQAVVALGFLSEEKFLTFMAGVLGLPFVDIRHHSFEAEVVQLLPESAARRFRAIPLSVGAGKEVVVGMADPGDIFVLDDLASVLRRPVRPVLVSERELLRILDRIYRRGEELRTQVEKLGEEVTRGQLDLDQLVQSEMLVDAPVVRILQSLFEDAMAMGASDIHIEPDEECLRIRQRIDGVLQERIVKEKQIAPALVSKLKLMAGLEISEKRLPQDGRFGITIKERKVDVRMSTLPIQFGESVVLRLLPQSSEALNLERTGMDPAILERFRYLISRPHGLVLLTGPTGSGKTTTLYGALTYLNDPGKKIVSVEDPVEYRLPRINQVQVNNKIGLTFARILRTVLRQDPDIVLVGEMRDQETAEIAIRAALTGHLVLSTLHTNDAVSTAIRLVDMGVEGFAVAGAMLGIAAQRLVRRVCPECKARYTPTDAERVVLLALAGPEALEQSYWRGQGCQTCHKTGYSGRIAVIELLEMRRTLADALRRQDSAEFVRLAATMPGFRPLPLAAWDFAVKGITTVEEVLRMVSHVAEDEPVVGTSAPEVTPTAAPPVP